MTDLHDPLDVPTLEHPDWPRHKLSEYPILVCIQFDETGAHALHRGLQLSRSHGNAPLHVLHVLVDSGSSGRTSVIDRNAAALDQAQVNLRAFVEERAGSDVEQARLHVRMGPAVDTILQTAFDYDAELIVVGTHARGTLSRMLFGSVAQGLVAAARCPVMVAMPRDFRGMQHTLPPDPSPVEG
jgi:nucleotide-binding universal stress UspA family protein